MTESEWLVCSDPRPMLDWLRLNRDANDRKYRLFAVACCYRIWPLLSQDQRKVVAIAEHHAEGRRTAEELHQANSWAARGFRSDRSHTPLGTYAVLRATSVDDFQPQWAAEFAANALAAAAVEEAGPQRALERTARGKRDKEKEHRRWKRAEQLREQVQWEERRYQTDLLRCLFGNPFASRFALPSAVREWHDGTPRRIAQLIHDERQFDDLPVLADALEDAGCDRPELLSHCRGVGPHSRGCWALDLLARGE